MNVIIRDADARAKVGAGLEGGVRLRQALAACVENIKSDTEHLVPKLTGDLRNSVDTSAGEEGIIKWNQPYSVYVYNMPASSNWTTKGTCPQWVEVAGTRGGYDRWGRIIGRVLNG